MYNDKLTGEYLLQLVEELNQFVQDYSDTYFCFQNDLLRMERRKQDFLHLSENDISGRLSEKYLYDLHMHLRERRYIKNQLELLEAAKIFMESVNSAKLKNCVGDMRRVRDRQENWVYNPKEMSNDEIDNYFMLGGDESEEIDEYNSPDFVKKSFDQIDSESA
ncbi:MAG: hypothetical protein LBB94_03485 [Clostridiales bacterium]|jgi:hypothetical protein|nr:hypothetical protein [Clostridiales bacterium]